MSRFRELDRRAHAHQFSIPSRSLFLIEDSIALGMLLRSEIERRTGINVKWFKTYADATAALAEQRPAMAVSGINLPDAPDGEILDLLAAHDVPTILFTATLNRSARARFSTPNIVDYFVKDTRDGIDQIVATIQRTTGGMATPVLIVDDMESSRAALASLLRSQNCRIFEASSGTEALDILAANDSIELVITDHLMSDMEGHELTQRIRARYPSDRMRVIGISASSDPFLSAAFLKAGASDFVYRPFIPEEVKYRIESNIDTLRLIKHLRYLAERDPLTGLYNRRAFFERAGTLFDNLRDAQREGSVAILDIDHFKRVNDTHGHDAGDQVIQMVADVLSERSAADGTLTARFGGEEFVILFAGRTSEEVYVRCEAIREAIAEKAVAFDGTSINVTVSLGAAILQPGEGMDNNLNAADQMLYMAKSGGRNRLVYDVAFCEPARARG
ncbi:diguanylate cyclase [Sphingomonas sp. HF-S4]|uniref:diguanylate cyclase n=1 Tax=Sphingomonas agrestis TaxID=3080540 RepID=A0ABU3Y2D7_9SPHN|nr:diguanylate cyclase [Sphingomonas sp. HF-S4]MDV3455441.1 diguanylate cyclase [Sphingomonas sp. HF-S4]